MQARIFLGGGGAVALYALFYSPNSGSNTSTDTEITDTKTDNIQMRLQMYVPPPARSGEIRRKEGGMGEGCKKDQGWKHRRGICALPLG